MENEENLALRYLMPPLFEDGHQVKLMAMHNRDMRELAVSVVRNAPAVVGMSVAFQQRLADFRNLTLEIKRLGYPGTIVWGGHIPTARGEEILNAYPQVDVVVRHDGEKTFRQLVEIVSTSAPGRKRNARLRQVEGLCFREEGRTYLTPPRAAVRDLDSLLQPWRARRPARHAGLGYAPILGSRGCWQKCVFCSIQTYHRGREGPRVRLRSPEAVAGEMATLYHRDGVRIFSFHDENFLLPTEKGTLKRLAELQQALDRRNVGRIGIAAKCRPDQLTRAVMKAAGRLGLVRVYMGIENGCQRGLDHLGRDTTVGVCRTALELVRQSPVFTRFNILLFEPDTTMADIGENLMFLRDYCDLPWKVCRTEVYPGSLLEQQLADQARLRGGLEGLSYTIADLKVEQLCAIFATAFSGRSFGEGSLLDRISDAGYLAALLEHFYGSRAAAGMRTTALELTTRLGTDTLARLEQAFEFVAGSEQSPADVRAFALSLSRRIRETDKELGPAITALRGEVDRTARSLAERAAGSSRPGRLATGATALVAALGIAGSACDGTKKMVSDTTALEEIGDDVPDIWEGPDIWRQEVWEGVDTPPVEEIWEGPDVQQQEVQEEIWEGPNPQDLQEGPDDFEE